MLLIPFHLLLNRCRSPNFDVDVIVSMATKRLSADPGAGRLVRARAAGPSEGPIRDLAAAPVSGALSLTDCKADAKRVITLSLLVVLAPSSLAVSPA